MKSTARIQDDPVKAGQIVATINPVPLEPQQRAALEARLQTAQELEREATARVQRAEADSSQAKADLERATKLAAHGVIAREALEKAQTNEKTATQRRKSHPGTSFRIEMMSQQPFQRNVLR